MARMHVLTMATAVIVGGSAGPIAVGALQQAGASQATSPPGASAPSVAVVSVVSQPLDRRVSLPGDLVAFQDVEIRSRTAGFVEAISVDRGSVVKKGGLLVRLVAPELAAQRSEAEAKARSAAAQRLEAEAKLASEEATYLRLKNASATPGVVAGNDLEIAQRTVEQDRARVDLWKQNEQGARDAARAAQDVQAYLRITAPFDGVITERNVHVGSMVAPSSAPMLRLQQVSTLRLVVAVPENAISSLQPGERIGFSVPAYPGQAFSGTLARAARAVDLKTRTMPVEMDVPNADGRLAPGMFASVAWNVRRPQASLFVPGSAIAATTERTFVVRVRNGMTEWIDVKRGSTMKQLIEVFGDLHAGDQIAVRGTDELRAGTHVTPKLAPPAQ